MKADEIDLFPLAIVEVVPVIFQVPRRRARKEIVPGEDTPDGERPGLLCCLSGKFARQSYDHCEKESGQEDPIHEGSFAVRPWTQKYTIWKEEMQARKARAHGS
jgi:hypothetical protein